MNLAKLIVFSAGLASRLLRDDPARALRLAMRLVIRIIPERTLPPRLRVLAGPAPRDPEHEARDLGELLEARQWPSPEGVRFPEIGDSGYTLQGAGVHTGSVLHLVTNALPCTRAGYTIRTHRIALAQRAAGLDPHVVTRLGFPLTQGIPDARTKRVVDGVPYHRLIPWLPPASPAAAVRKGAEHASRLVERLRPKVLHAASNHLNAAVALELRERHDLPVVYEVRGFLEDSWLSRDQGHSPEAPFYTRTRALETRCMRSADVVVTLGEAMRAEIISRGVNPAKVLTVPNGVDDVFLEPLPNGAAVRMELGIAPDAVVAGLTSTFYGYEGIGTLIEAAALLRDRGVPLTLLLVGDGPELPALREKAAGLGNVIFTGRVPPDQVRRYHAALDIFAVPRTADRVSQLVTPLKPLEAMAGGIPVIASDVKALREIIEPGLTGTLTLPEYSESWADSLAELIYSPEERRELGEAAREWVRSNRTWRQVTARYINIYDALG